MFITRVVIDQNIIKINQEKTIDTATYTVRRKLTDMMNNTPDLYSCVITRFLAATNFIA